jgi:hypothetical protein
MIGHLISWQLKVTTTTIPVLWRSISEEGGSFPRSTYFYILSRDFNRSVEIIKDLPKPKIDNVRDIDTGPSENQLLMILKYLLLDWDHYHELAKSYSTGSRNGVF